MACGPVGAHLRNLTRTKRQFDKQHIGRWRSLFARLDLEYRKGLKDPRIPGTDLSIRQLTLNPNRAFL
jgi:hypothetical protein